MTADGLFPEPAHEVPAEVIARMAPPGLDPLDWTADHLQAFIHASLIRRDMQGVAHALRRLAFVDPHRAQLILDLFDMAEAVAE